MSCRKLSRSCRVAATVASLALLSSTFSAAGVATLDLDTVLRAVAEQRPKPPVNAAASTKTPGPPPASAAYGEAWRTYAEAYFSQVLAMQCESRLATLDRIRRLALSVYQAGRGGYHEVLSTEAALARARADHAAAVGDTRVGRARLDVLMGRVATNGDEVLIPPPIPDIPLDSEAWTRMVTPAPGGEPQATRETFLAEQRGEVMAAHTAALHAQRLSRLLADTVIVARQRAFDAAWSAYADGMVQLAAVLQEAHALFDEQGSLIAARREMAVAQARFVALTGHAELFGVMLPRSGRGSP